MSESRAEVRARQLSAGNKTRRNGKPKRTGWRKWVFGTLKWGTISGLVLGLMGAIFVFVAYQRASIPEPNQLAQAQVSIIYYADGKTELDRMVVADGNRESVPLASVPKPVQQAHLSAEDRSFYSNSGVSPSGILRAIKSGITGGQQVGGSTITQQYVKNFYLTQDRTLTRKFNEILISIKIDQQLSKDKILENYLNTIYYGRGAYGIQMAAKAYFNKPAAKLTTPEGAVLASIINAPSLYDPAQGSKALERLTKRYNYVLDGMVEEGWLTQAERDTYTELPKIQPYKRTTSGSPTNGYITAEVRKELLKIGLTDAEIDAGGLRITTTIDKKQQDAAVAAMKDNLPKGVTGGLIAMRPGTGAVVAMYGGADYSKSELNTSTQAILQAGSNFKPFTVLAAVRDGISTKARFNGNSPEKFGDTRIENFGHRSYGRVDMRRMIGRSINTAFVELNEKIGPAKTKQAAIDAGIPANTNGLDDSLTNVLGSSAPHVIDMATAYSTIASQGVRTEPYFIGKVTSTVNPEFTYQAAPKGERAFDQEVTADVTDAMTYTVKDGGSATKLQRLNRPIAGKTGTSENNKSIWFTGFVPQLTVSVGLYKPDENGTAVPMTDDEGYNLTGGTIPADIWFDFMQVALKGVPVEQFPKRAGVGDDAAPTNTERPTDVGPTTTRTTTSEPTTTDEPTTTQEPTTTSEPPVTSTPPPVTTTRPPTSEPPTPTQTRPTGRPTRTTTTPPAGEGGQPAASTPTRAPVPAG